MKKTIYIVGIFFFAAVGLGVACGPYFLPKILSAYVSSQVKADVKIRKAGLSLKGGIKAQAVSISNSRGLECEIEEADIRMPGLSFLAGPVPLSFTLKNVEFSYPEAAVITTITNALSLTRQDLFKFDTVTGQIYKGKGEFAVKGLNASGSQMRLFIEGTIINDTRIDCCFRIWLADVLVASIPETVRKVFFKMDGSWQKVELFLTGDIKSPSINFSTDLFQLRIGGDGP